MFLKESIPGVIRVPEWSEFPWLRAGFSTRVGGRTSVYGLPHEQNLGFTKDDEPGTVNTNRERFLRVVQDGGELPLLTVGQIHSDLIHAVDVAAEVESLLTADGKPILRGDGLLCRSPGLMLGIVTADCVPVLLADTKTHAVGGFHAGWRGTVARIAEQGAMRMQEEFGSRAEDLIAAIGPGIGVCCFAVGDKVRREFEGLSGDKAELVRRDGPQAYVDLIEANRRQLMAAGVLPEKISVVGDCTACTRLEDGERKYFSHRAEKGFTGRMLSVVGAVA